PDDLVVVLISPVPRVKSHEPQVAGEYAEVNVAHEPGPPERARAQPGDRCNVQALEHGIYRAALSAGKPSREIDRLAVDQHKVHFGVRHADCLDRILDRWRASERIVKLAFAKRWREEIVQLLVEAKLRHGWG